MNLSNLKPAEGSTKTRKRIGRGPDLVWVVLLQEVIKVLNQDQVIQRRLVLKVDRCLFNVVFRSLVLRILTV